MGKAITEVLSPTHQAEIILKAWVCADETKLRRELQAGLNLCTVSRAVGFEEEMVDLLEAVLGRLNDCPSLITADRNDPGVRLCINLLMHLADQSRAFPMPPVSAPSIHDSI